ncbi:MAG: DUF4422 domain-containing protein [Candidatus Odinarchaeota archaeon]
MDKKRVKIFTCHHKGDLIFQNEIYEPIHGGKKISSINLNIPGDDTGINISDKNQRYAELTVLYWIWKNKKYEEYDYVGLHHYRRYLDLYHSFKKYRFFLKNRIKNQLHEIFSKNKLYIKLRIKFFEIRKKKKEEKRRRGGLTLSQFKKLSSMRPKHLKKYFSEYEIIIPKKNHLFITIEEQYKKVHLSNDLNILKEVLYEKYEKYIHIIEEFFDCHTINYFNIFIIKSEIFKHYCTWLFDILFEVEKRLDFTNRDQDQVKALGFMGERLLSLFLFFNKKKFKILELPLVSIRKD